jgi:hypothetical protein
MLRNLFAVAIGLAVLPPAVQGSGFQPIVRLSGTYIPGLPASFDVRLPNITNLGSYNIDLVLEGSTGAAGVDFYFDAAATLPAAASYVFPSSANYVDAVTVDSATRHRITLTDYDFSGANIANGTNDRVATVVFRTAATMNSPLSIFVDAPLLILDTPEVLPTPVPGFSMIQADIAAAGNVTLVSVPEPSTLLLVAFCVTAQIDHRGARRTVVCGRRRHGSRHGEWLRQIRASIFR